MQSLALRTDTQIKFFYFFWVGPPIVHKLQAVKKFIFIFYLWDKLGRAIPAIESEDNMQLKDNTKKTEERKNRFNGESVMLTAEEARRHDNIFINELAATMEDKTAGIDGTSKKWDQVRKDINWFRQHNASAYMVLLD